MTTRRIDSGSETDHRHFRELCDQSNARDGGLKPGTKATKTPADARGSSSSPDEAEGRETEAVADSASAGPGSGANCDVEGGGKRSLSGCDCDGAGPIENMEFVKVKDRGGSAAGGSCGGGIPEAKGSSAAVGAGSSGLDDNAPPHEPGRRPSSPLYFHSSIPEIDNLVGWATSHRGARHFDSEMESATADEGRRLGLAHIPAAPPPPSHVAYLRGRIAERIGKGASGGGGGGKAGAGAGAPRGGTLAGLDASAYVAVGMAVEEALTMSLMPLARAHVARCRRLETRKRGRDPGDDPFHAWTLPPAEAVSRLAGDEPGSKSHVALAYFLQKHTRQAGGNRKA